MIYCTKCEAPVDVNDINTKIFVACRSCGARSRTDVFPAISPPDDAVQTAEQVIVTDDASCFYHPKKQAVVHCTSCGRFLCALCDVEIDNTHLCFSCMETGKKKSKLNDLETNRTIYDGFALRVALYPILMWPFTLITAPIALFMVIKYWKAPTSIIKRTRIRFIAAFIIAFAQVAAWVTGIIMVVSS